MLELFKSIKPFQKISTKLSKDMQEIHLDLCISYYKYTECFFLVLYIIGLTYLTNYIFQIIITFVFKIC
jgi:hypothetical protein